MFPYSSIHDLSEADSRKVRIGARSVDDCVAVRSLHPMGGGAIGGMGLVRADFLRRHGGMIEGFLGWGAEDNAWVRKVSLLGRVGKTRMTDQVVWHLHHPQSGGAGGQPSRRNPHYQRNVELLSRVRTGPNPGGVLAAVSDPGVHDTALGNTQEYRACERREPRLRRLGAKTRIRMDTRRQSDLRQSCAGDRYRSHQPDRVAQGAGRRRRCPSGRPAAGRCGSRKRRKWPADFGRFGRGQSRSRVAGRDRERFPVFSPHATANRGMAPPRLRGLASKLGKLNAG